MLPIEPVTGLIKETLRKEHEKYPVSEETFVKLGRPDEAHEMPKQVGSNTKLTKNQLKILNITIQKTNRNLGISVLDTAVIRDSGLPVDEVRFNLGQLAALGLIEIGGAEFNLLSVTKEGLDRGSEGRGVEINECCGSMKTMKQGGTITPFTAFGHETGQI